MEAGGPLVGRRRRCRPSPASGLHRSHMSDVLADAEKQYAAAKSRRARIEKAWKAAARADFTRNRGVHGSSPGRRLHVSCGIAIPDRAADDARHNEAALPSPCIRRPPP